MRPVAWGWDCLSPGGWPGFSVGSCARSPGMSAAAAASCSSCPPAQEREESFMKTSRGP